MLAADPAAAAPGTAAEAIELVQKAAQELTVIDEQVHQAEITVAEQQQAAAGAAAAAAAAQPPWPPTSRSCGPSPQSGYTGENQSRVAAFLTSESAAELVQQMTTLDMIAAHTNAVIARVAAAQDAAEEAQAAADAAAATAEAGLAELEAQQAEVQQRVEQYQADFARLTAEERAPSPPRSPVRRCPPVGDELPSPPAAPPPPHRRPRSRRSATPTSGAPPARTPSTARA